MKNTLLKINVILFVLALLAAAYTNYRLNVIKREYTAAMIKVMNWCHENTNSQSGYEQPLEPSMSI